MGAFIKGTGTFVEREGTLDEGVGTFVERVGISNEGVGTFDESTHPFWEGIHPIKVNSMFFLNVQWKLLHIRL